MPAPLVPIRLQNPGSFGLNSQEKYGVIDPRYGTILKNAAFDASGRVVSRKGWTKSTSSGSPGGYEIESMYAYEDGTNTVIISAANGGIYYGTGTMTSITITPVVSAANNNWQFDTWIDGSGNKYLLAWQAGEEPMISQMTGAVPGTWAALQTSVTASGTGTVPTGNAVHVAFGRIWAVDSDGLNVIGCATLDHLNWSTGAFSFDVSSYWPDNAGDRITAITSWEDKLVVFGSQNILIYDNPDDTANWALVDTISGVGCVGRDTIQRIGSDLFFMSTSGMRSLQRTIQNEKLPLQEVGNQVRDDVVDAIVDNEATLKSAYSPKDGFYLLVIKDSAAPLCYLYDFKSSRRAVREGLDQPIPHGMIRISKWTGFEPGAMCFGLDGFLYGGFRDDAAGNACVGYYGGYNDDTSSYVFQYASPWLDMSQLMPEAMSFQKILKSARITTIGGPGYSPQFTWSYDHSYSNAGSYSYSIPDATTAAASQFGLGKWGESYWGFTEDLTINDRRINLAGRGDKFRVGLLCVIDGASFGLQDLQLFMKKGRLAR